MAAVASGLAAMAMYDQVPNQTVVSVPPSTLFPSVTQVTSSLYVGDLDQSVLEEHLLNLFIQVAPVLTLRICRDLTRRSLGYAYVNFANPNDAMLAMERLNYTPIKGRPIRIMLSNRDPSTRLSGKGNVFIKNLDASFDNKALYHTFSSYGTILSCKVATDLLGKSKGYGFVQFEKEESAQIAIDKLNGTLLNNKQLFVGHFVRRQDRVLVQRFTNVYVKNLPKEITDNELKMTFGKYGDISSAVVMKDQSGNSRCFGFVNFENPEAAVVAIEKMNGINLGDDVLYVGRAQKKSEREEELRRKFEQERISRFEKSKGSNLYMKNLDDSVNDEKLKEIFSEYGNVTSCKVMMNSKGFSRGFGFVAYSKPEEATRALNEMNGKIIGRKPLYIALAQRKEERRAHLQTLFAQMGQPGTLSPMSGFHHHLPRGPMYIGQNSQGLVPSQGYGYQLQSMYGVRPDTSLANFMVPYHLQRHTQLGPRDRFRHGAPNMRNGMEASAPKRKPPPLTISKLASALAKANPVDHPEMLGEMLYPLVEQLESVQTAKVTGMLLEMDQAEILHLLESPEALKAKVSEALDVLKSLC